MTFIAELIGITPPVQPRVRAAVRGCMGFIDELSVDRLTHGCDIDLDELEELTLSAMAGALAHVCTAETTIVHVVDDLRSEPGAAVFCACARTRRRDRVGMTEDDRRGHRAAAEGTGNDPEGPAVPHLGPARSGVSMGCRSPSGS
jgi:hypothetical protein